MTLTHITPKQKELLLHLHTFRFLTTIHIQKIFNHKDPRRTQKWLKDLHEKNYIKAYIDIHKTKPTIYYLAPLARQLLKVLKKYDDAELSYLYQEHRRTEKFIASCLFLAEIYFFFLSKKQDSEEIHFFPSHLLHQYEYFPYPRPSAYIAVTTKETTQRYFLDIFDDYTPLFVLRERVKAYVHYATSGDWEAHAGSEPLPIILFVCPSRKTYLHIVYYAKGLFEKEYEESLQLFLTTKDKIQIPQRGNIWEQVTL